MCCTSTRAPGKSLGKGGKNFMSGAGAPVDGATNTIGNLPPLRAGIGGGGTTGVRSSGIFWAKVFVGGSLRGALVAISCCSLDRVAVRTTRTFAAILSLRPSSSFTELMYKSMPPEGLATKSMAPSSSALSVTSAPSRDSELTIRMGRGLVDMMTSLACNPSMCGMLMSMVITSGFRTSACVTASRPSRASPHTSSCGSAVIMVCNTLRMNAESSTISTRILLLVSIMSNIFLLHNRCHVRRCADTLTDQPRYCGNELVFLNRLGQKRRRAVLDGTIAMLGSRARRNHHYRNIACFRTLPDVRQELVTVRARHLKVRDHQVAADLRDDLQRFQSVRREAHAITGFLQHASYELAHADGVVHQHNNFFVRNHFDGFWWNRAVGHSFRSGSKDARSVGAGHQRTALDGFAGNQAVYVDQQNQTAVR